MLQIEISNEERESIIRRYNGFNSYNLFIGRPWRVVAEEVRYYWKTHNGNNPTYNSNLVQCRKVAQVLDGKFGISCFSDGSYARIIRSDKNENLFTLKITKTKIVNDEERPARTEIIPNIEEIEKILGQERIDDSNNCKVTLTKNVKLPKINESVLIKDEVTCVVTKAEQPSYFS